MPYLSQCASGDIMKKMVKEVTGIEYVVHVDIKKIHRHDNTQCDRDLPTVYDRLNRIEGIYKLDYDAHFGNYVSLSISKEHDTDDTWNKVKEVLRPFLV